MEKQRKDISPEETLTQPFIVGIPDFRSGVVLNFEMDYIQYKDPYLYVSYCLGWIWQCTPRPTRT